MNALLIITDFVLQTRWCYVCDIEESIWCWMVENARRHFNRRGVCNQVKNMYMCMFVLCPCSFARLYFIICTILTLAWPWHLFHHTAWWALYIFFATCKIFIQPVGHRLNNDIRSSNEIILKSLLHIFKDKINASCLVSKQNIFYL